MITRLPFNPSKRGLTPAYRTGTHCPGCGHRNWIIGRVLAECARCTTAVPLARAS